MNEQSRTAKHLHDKMWTMLDKLEKNEVKPAFAKEYFNGCGKIINSCKNQLQAISMGCAIDVDLLEIKAEDINLDFIKPVPSRKIKSLLD